MEKKRMAINLISTLIAFAINMGINFVLTPYIVTMLGDEAYGFITLANNFVNYASIVTLALNSVSGRFISIKIHQNKKEEANVYYNSVLISNIIMSSIFALISLILIINLNKLIHIPNDMIFDVKLTFTLVFINFILNMFSSIFNIATFVKNRIDLSSSASILGYIIRLFLLIILFCFLKPRIFYISIAAIVYTSIIIGFNYAFTKKLLKEIKFNLKMFSIKAIKEITSLGIWNSINNLSNILLTGLDLLIANVFIGPKAMGVLSIAKTIPSVITTFLGTVGGVYAPKFTILYAEGKKEELVNEVKLSIKVLGLLITVPLAGFVIFGSEFYSLWLPSKTTMEINEIQLLSIITLGPVFVSAFVYSLYNINTVTNKLKVPVKVYFGISIISTILVFILLKLTKLGVYAIAGVSSTLLLLNVIFFVPSYAAYSLNIDKLTFYPPIIKGVTSFIIITIGFYLVKLNVQINTWIDLIIVAFIVGVIGYIFNLFIALNKNERKIMLSVIKNKIKKNN